MTIAVFVTIWAPAAASNSMSNDFLDRPLTFLQAVPEVISVDLYVPETGGVAEFKDDPAPALMLQVDTHDADDAKDLIQKDAFQRLILARAAYSEPVDKVSLDILETVHFPLPGHARPPPRTARTSFVVRYYGPTADEAAFVRFYTEHHPLLLATFPDIRNVLCYLPLNWQSTGEVADSRVILGNEVVFDDLEALNRALASDVLPRLRAEGKQFAKFGRSTHHAMRRERVYTRGEL